MRPFLVLVTGSRTWTDELAIFGALAWTTRVHGMGITIMHGAHWEGADALTDRIARAMGLDVEPVAADWSGLGRRAGPIRNQVMVDRHPDLCLAFHIENSTGTADCVRRCDAADIPVVTYRQRRTAPTTEYEET